MKEAVIMSRAKILSLILVLAIVFALCAVNIDAKTSIKSKSVSINVSRVTLAVGDIATLSAIMKPANSTDKLTWKSSNDKVAIVNSYGTVTAKAEGKATITVKTSSKRIAECEVTVKQVLSSEEIEALVRSELLSDESIKKLITDNTISKEAIKKLIAENTLSEDDVKKLIRAEAAGTWVDGAEIPMYSGQILPVLIGDPKTTGIVGSIKTIKISKRRMKTGIYQKGSTIYLPYKYDVILTVDVSSITDAQKTSHYVDILLGAPDAPDIMQFVDPYISSYAGNTLTEIMSFYSAYDVDEYYIRTSSWELK